MALKQNPSLSWPGVCAGCRECAELSRLPSLHMDIGLQLLKYNKEERQELGSVAFEVNAGLLFNQQRCVWSSFCLRSAGVRSLPDTWSASRKKMDQLSTDTWLSSTGRENMTEKLLVLFGVQQLWAEEMELELRSERRAVVSFSP